MREYQKTLLHCMTIFRMAKTANAKRKKSITSLRNSSCTTRRAPAWIPGLLQRHYHPQHGGALASVVGVGIDMTAMRLIDPRENPAVAYVYGDAMGLPFADEAFEALVCPQTYEHVPSSPHLFAEVLRVMKAGGVVFFSGPNKTFLIEPHYYLPCLHWLPEKWADRHLRLTKRGTHYLRALPHLLGPAPYLSRITRRTTRCVTCCSITRSLIRKRACAGVRPGCQAAALFVKAALTVHGEYQLGPGQARRGKNGARNIQFAR